jgi:hypothetical protein
MKNSNSFFNYFIKTVLTVYIFVLTPATFAVTLPDAQAKLARAILESISKQLNGAVARTEMIYQNLGNNGIIQTSTTTDYAENLLTSTTDQYLQFLKIANAGLKIQLQFVSRGMGQSKYASALEPVSSPLLGKRIMLIPVYNYTSDTVRDAKISSYDCLTDADSGLSDVEVFEGDASFIGSYSNNKYLGKCQYLAPSTLDGYWVFS